MNVRLIFFSVLVFMVFSLTSCQKDDGDTTRPVITITSPAEGAILEKGKTYEVTGTVTDDTELAEIKVGTITITTFDSPTSHAIKGIILTIDENQTSGNGNIVVTAKDKAGNEETKVVNFSVN